MLYVEFKDPGNLEVDHLVEINDQILVETNSEGLFFALYYTDNQNLKFDTDQGFQSECRIKLNTLNGDTNDDGNKVYAANFKIHGSDTVEYALLRVKVFQNDEESDPSSPRPITVNPA